MADTREWQEGTTLTPSERRGSGSGSFEEEASRMGEEALEKGKGFLEGQKKTAAESLGRIASVFHDTARNLEREQPTVSRFLDEGADALDRFSGTLRERDTETLLRQAQDFARRQPGLVLGGAVAAGFLISRMLKSSTEHSSGEYLGEGRGIQGMREKMQSAAGEIRSGKEEWKRTFESKAEDLQESLRSRREHREEGLGEERMQAGVEDPLRSEESLRGTGGNREGLSQGSHTIEEEKHATE